MNNYKFKNDFIASIVVFLVAVPLCLGIALASGVPVFSGILTGIIGGIVVGFLSESQVSVSGPAAGMIVIVITAISQLGSYEAFLFALFIAGFLQIAMGALKTGFFADYVPSNVIQGLLVAIGILVIIKQLPLAFGVFQQTEALQASLKEAQESFTLVPLLNLMTHINLGATFITIVSLLLLFLWDKIPLKYFKAIPAAIIVVILGVILSKLFDHFVPPLALHKTNLINFPVSENFASLMASFKHPNFQDWKNINIYIYAVMIAVVASIETLLNLEAAEKIDKKHRYCSRNRELVAQGIANALSGFVGGLPITSVIIRTSVNIGAGARSKVSTILHGFFLLLALTAFPGMLNHIPIASLAAILIFTGYKLARWSVFKEMYDQGFVYFFPFLVTVIAIIFTNLLLGILIGLFVSSFFILRYNSKSFFTTIHEKHPSGEVIRLILPQQATFLNKPSIITGLKRLPKHSRVIIDAKGTDYIDTDILNIIKEFKNSQAPYKNILLNLEGFHEHYEIGDQTDFINVTTFGVQENLTREDIYEILKEGNHRFVNNKPIHKNFKQQIEVTSKSQHPMAVILGCIDSRVPVEFIFDMTVGDVFVVRVAGNISNDDILASIEFACKIAGAKLIVVIGHTECGAIKAACEDAKLGHLTQLVEKIRPAIEAEVTTIENRTSDNKAFMYNVTKNNVDFTKKYIYENSQLLRNLIDKHEIGIVGAIYDVKTGIVDLEPLSS